MNSTYSKNHIFNIILQSLIILLFLNIFIIEPAEAEESSSNGIGDSENTPDLPDLTHQYLGAHAAESHGNSSEEINWISLGAFEEDQIFMFHWHSWDPDTGEFWVPSIGGPSLERANMLFWDAVELFPFDESAAWMLLGQSLHLLQDLSTPAHAHADSHICIFGGGDCDAYETWLGESDLVNTFTWINNNPPGLHWNMDFRAISDWGSLSNDLKNQLELANNNYGERSSAFELWKIGPVGIDPVIFQLMFLMGEHADNYNSGGDPEYPGEAYNEDLGDQTYLSTMRDNLFPMAVIYSTAWIDYFERQIGIQDEIIYLPILNR